MKMWKDQCTKRDVATPRHVCRQTCPEAMYSMSDVLRTTVWSFSIWSFNYAGDRGGSRRLCVSQEHSHKLKKPDSTSHFWMLCDFGVDGP